MHCHGRGRERSATQWLSCCGCRGRPGRLTPTSRCHTAGIVRPFRAIQHASMVARARASETAAAKQCELLDRADASDARRLGPWQRGERGDAGWDTTAIARQWMEALKGRQSEDHVTRTVANLLNAEPQASTRDIRSEVERALCPVWMDQAVIARINRVYIQGELPWRMTAEMVESIRLQVCKFPKHCSLSVVGCVLNLWCISHRVHDIRRDKCLLECPFRR